MLNYIRKRTSSWGLKVLYIVLAMTFLGGFGGLFGILRGCGTGLSQGTIAVVNRHAIPLEEFSRTYKNTINAYNKEFKGKLSMNLIKKMDIPDRVLDNLISNAIATKQASSIGFVVTASELKSQITHMPNFLNKKDQFDPRIYYAVLRENDITPDEFQQTIKDDLLTLKLKRLFFDSIFLSNSETKTLNVINNTAISLNYYEIIPKALKLPRNYKGSNEEYAAKLANTYLKDLMRGEKRLPVIKGIKRNTTDLFTLQGSLIPTIGDAPDIAEYLLTLKKPGNTINRVFTVDGNLYIVQLNSIKPAQQSQDIAQMATKMRFDAGLYAYNSWMQDLIRKAHIKKNTALLARFTQGTE